MYEQINPMNYQEITDNHRTSSPIGEDRVNRIINLLYAPSVGHGSLLR